MRGEKRAVLLTGQGSFGFSGRRLPLWSGFFESRFEGVLLMELYEGIRNALKNRGCPWIEEHVFEFMGQRLHLDIHDLGQNYSLKIVHRAADKDKMDKSEPYIAKNFSLEKTVAKSTLRRGSLKTICENLADGFLFWLESMSFTPAVVRETVPVRDESRTRRPR